MLLLRFIDRFHNRRTINVEQISRIADNGPYTDLFISDGSRELLSITGEYEKVLKLLASVKPVKGPRVTVLDIERGNIYYTGNGKKVGNK